MGLKVNAPNFHDVFEDTDVEHCVIATILLTQEMGQIRMTEQTLKYFHIIVQNLLLKCKHISESGSQQCQFAQPFYGSISLNIKYSYQILALAIML